MRVDPTFLLLTLEAVILLAGVLVFTVLRLRRASRPGVEIPAASAQPPAHQAIDALIQSFRDSVAEALPNGEETGGNQLPRQADDLCLELLGIARAALSDGSADFGGGEARALRIELRERVLRTLREASQRAESLRSGETVPSGAPAAAPATQEPGLPGEPAAGATTREAGELVAQAGPALPADGGRDAGPESADNWASADAQEVFKGLDETLYAFRNKKKWLEMRLGEIRSGKPDAAQFEGLAGMCVESLEDYIRQVASTKRDILMCYETQRVSSEELEKKFDQLQQVLTKQKEPARQAEEDREAAAPPRPGAVPFGPGVESPAGVAGMGQEASPSGPEPVEDSPAEERAGEAGAGALPGPADETLESLQGRLERTEEEYMALYSEYGPLQESVRKMAQEEIDSRTQEKLKELEAEMARKTGEIEELNQRIQSRQSDATP